MPPNEVGLAISHKVIPTPWDTANSTGTVSLGFAGRPGHKAGRYLGGEVSTAPLTTTQEQPEDPSLPIGLYCHI